MFKFTIQRGIAAAILSVGCAQVHAASITLNYNYMATNLFGALATPVATLKLTDLADLGIANPIAGATGGVQAEFRVNQGGLAQFASGHPGTQVFISAYELNFPGTSPISLPSTGQISVPLTGPAGALGGYTAAGLGTFTQGYNLRSDNWAYVSGANFQAAGPNGTAGGIEWQEDGGLPQGWGAGAGDPSFEQELNWGNTPVMVEGQFSIVNLFNAAGSTSISVAALLGNPVANANDSTQPEALSWIKLRGTAALDPNERGIAASGFWGNSETSTITPAANTQNRLNVLALAPTPVPLPPSIILMAPALAWLSRRARRAN